MYMYNTLTTLYEPVFSDCDLESCDFDSEFRTISGCCNNQIQPDFGKINPVKIQNVTVSFSVCSLLKGSFMSKSVHLRTKSDHFWVPLVYTGRGTFRH